LETQNKNTLSNYKSGLDFALEQDQNDELASYRNQFHFPKDKNGHDWKMYPMESCLDLILEETNSLLFTQRGTNV
jgi:hypothetical protein